MCSTETGQILERTENLLTLNTTCTGTTVTWQMKWKNIYIYIYKTKGGIFKSCNKIKDKNIHPQVEMNRNLDKQEIHLPCGRTLSLLAVVCPEG